MKRYSIIIILLLSSTLSPAQNSDRRAQLSVAPWAGLLLGGYTAYSFYNVDGPVLTKPLMAFGIGVQYGPLVNIEGLDLSTSLEAAFGRLTTHDHGRGLDRVKMEIQRLPVMVWFTFESETRFSLYGRIAIGACQTDFHEEYANPYYPSVRFHAWTFSWAYGIGLRYRCSDNIDLVFFKEQWTTENKIITRNRWGDVIGLEAPHGDNPTGFKIILRP